MIEAQLMLLDNKALDAVRVDDWPNPRRPVKTVMIHSDDFAGTVTVQASLHVVPTDDDWFDIHVESFAITGTLETKARNRFFNTRDNYVWMRATVNGYKGRIDRVLVI